MIPPNKLEQLSNEPIALVKRLQKWTIEAIARSIAENARLTATAEHQLSRFMQIRAFDVDLQKEIAKITGKSTKEIERIMKDAAKTSYKYNKRLYTKKGIPYIPYEQNGYMQDLTSTITSLTQEEMYNITRSLGFAERINGKMQFKPVARFYQDELDNTALKIQTGVRDYNSAIRETVKKMAASGLRTIDYASGRSNRIDVAVRRAVMTGLKKISHEQAEYQARKLGITTFEISYHSGHRPSHGWGGRRFTTIRIPDIDEQTGKPFLLREELFEKYGGGTLDDINCYHDIFDIYPDDKPIYSDEKIKELEKSEEELVKYGDKWYNKYEAKQHQRALEYSMRKTRLEVDGFKAAGLDDDAMVSQVKYMRYRQEYKKFSDAMDLKTEYERVFYDNLNKVGGKITAIPVDIPTPAGYNVRIISKHTFEQMTEKHRNLSMEQVRDALKNPLHIGEIKIDDKGRPSQNFIGKYATVSVNPQNYVATTTWRTGSKTLKKIWR